MAWMVQTSSFKEEVWSPRDEVVGQITRGLDDELKDLLLEKQISSGNIGSSRSLKVLDSRLFQ